MQVYTRPKKNLLGSSLAFTLKEGPVRCAKVCIKSWVILLCYLAGNFQTAPTIFSYFQDIFLNGFIKNPQTRKASAFLPLNISAVGSVECELWPGFCSVLTEKLHDMEVTKP